MADGIPGNARKPATDHTRAAHRHSVRHLDFEDEASFEEAARGFIAPLPAGPVLKESGEFVWDPSRLDFTLDGECPDTANPSLWRMAKLVAGGGLFKVCDRIFQVRSMDISNLTLIEGDTGVIVVDPLISSETARAALGLYFEHRGRRPVVAVIHSHSHVDHYGGVKGVVEESDVSAGRVPVIAPDGFLEAAVSENVAAGNVMTRRAMYQFGPLLPPDPQGTLGAGLGLTTSLGTVTLIPPTDTITATGETRTIDGLTFEFMLTPDTEAPAEMHWFIPELAALTAAENCVHTLHNTYPIRGAQVRDPQAWSIYLNQTIDRWADRSEVMYGMHHWPVWGSARVREMLEKGRDAYRYINDETLRLANHGLVPKEIAERVELPPGLARHWSVRSYYGTVSHNVKATYTRYLGWYDGNPANLEPLPPVEAASRYVAAIGGAEALLGKARAAFAKGEYRWVAELVGHAVFADPANREARELQADAFEQLGYQSESATWRNAYLTGAQELRNGTPDLPIKVGTASPDSISAMTLPMIFNFLGVKLNGERASALEITLNLSVGGSDGDATDVLLRLVNGVLHHSIGLTDEYAPRLGVSRELLDRIVSGESGEEDLADLEGLPPGPGRDSFLRIAGLLDEFRLWFPVIEP
ncbi:MAG: MBL fold metallo-hydrolase [Solirubrobacterales bacterium]|nr:MBL fold metallo-hydrolase [Solirubrobacterales bacterium]